MSSVIPDDLFAAQLHVLLFLGKYTLPGSCSPNTDRQQDAYAKNPKWQLCNSSISLKTTLFFPKVSQ